MNFAQLSQVLLWVLLLTNLAVTLRILSWLRGRYEYLKELEQQEHIPDLELNTLAPDFRALALSGGSVSKATYQDQAVLFVFFSTSCLHCRLEMPEIIKLQSHLVEKLSIKVVLVCLERSKDILAWKDTLLVEDKLDIGLPILTAPQGVSDLFDAYNPKNVTPYFCYVDESGRVKARGSIGNRSAPWMQLKQKWYGNRPGIKVEQFASRYSRN